MSRVEEYRQAIREQTDIREYLLINSNLPGPRGNLELAQAASLEVPTDILVMWSKISASDAPVNTALEFLAFCGVLGQGRIFLEGDSLALDRILLAANDSRWRTREAAAMALQFIGKTDMRPLYQFLPTLAIGTPLEQRCAVAAICEPALLKTPSAAQFALQILDTVTESFSNAAQRKSDGFIALKKGLGYGWSVAVAASMTPGKELMEKWLQSNDKDVAWVMRENLKKKRLVRLDEGWVNRRLAK